MRWRKWREWRVRTSHWRCLEGLEGLEGPISCRLLLPCCRVLLRYRPAITSLKTMGRKKPSLQRQPLDQHKLTWPTRASVLVNKPNTEWDLEMMVYQCICIPKSMDFIPRVHRRYSSMICGPKFAPHPQIATPKKPTPGRQCIAQTSWCQFLWSTSHTFHLWAFNPKYILEYRFSYGRPGWQTQNRPNTKKM